MNILAVDDEVLQLDKLQDSIKRAFPNAIIYAVNKPSEAMKLTHKINFTFAFLDIQMRTMTGIELASVLKASEPELKVIFVTAYDEYRKSTEDVAPFAFILKPVNPQKIFDSVQASPQRNGSAVVAQAQGAMLQIRTGEQFQVFDRNHHQLCFTRSKARELFAYLVYRQGEFCSPEELISIILRDEKVGQDKRETLQEILDDMMKTLKRSAAEGVVRDYCGSYAVDPDRIDCDFYEQQKKVYFFTRFLRRRSIPEYAWSDNRT